METREIVMGFGIEPADRLHLTQEPGWEKRTINLVSGLSHNYRDVTVLPGGLTPVVDGPKPGERALDALLVREPKRRLYDAFRRPQFTLLVAPGTAAPDAVIDIGTQVRDQLNKLFPGQVSTYLISRGYELRFDFDHQSADEEDQFTERYDIPAEGRLVLVRPDLYVGMACVPDEWQAVAKYMTQWFLPRGDDAKNGVLKN